MQRAAAPEAGSPLTPSRLPHLGEEKLPVAGLVEADTPRHRHGTTLRALGGKGFHRLSVLPYGPDHAATGLAIDHVAQGTETRLCLYLVDHLALEEGDVVVHRGWVHARPRDHQGTSGHRRLGDLFGHQVKVLDGQVTPDDLDRFLPGFAQCAVSGGAIS